MKKVILLIAIAVMSCNQTKQERPNQTLQEDVNDSAKEEIIEPKQEEEEEKPIKIGLYNNPMEFDYKPLLSSNFCKLGASSNCYLNKIYPLGWNQEGLFAYFEEIPPAFTGRIIVLRIIDLITDKDVLRENWHSEDEEGNEDFQIIWNRNKNEIALHLSKYNIQQTTENWNFHQTPIEFQNTNYYFEIKEKRDSSDFIIDQEIKIRTPLLGQKKIYSRGKKGEFQMLRNSKIAGCFKSPLEDRIAILKLDEERGFEGDFIISAQIIGCHMTEGYE